MKLILNGDAKNTQGSKQGVYILKEKLVNSHPSWLQQNGIHAIWFRDTHRRWYVGLKEYLGGGISGIRGPRGIDMSPTRIVNGWKYYKDGLYKDAASTEITFKDITPGMHFLALVFHYQTIIFHIS